ncbi:hypothetical protein TIFTF001_037152 [Ficus carica]|uniref:CC-NBS-LRR protein n=1 Tax=Ficus carica TaxID=3494 RepID=A0AA88E5K4_FICCA|nr:hypothetical protein TIFTF001_037152 [Ficus carica]
MAMKLNFHKLVKLEDLSKDGLQHLISFEELTIEKCENLQCLSQNGLPTSLTSLRLSELPKLEDLSKGSLQHPIYLKELRACLVHKFKLKFLSLV